MTLEHAENLRSPQRESSFTRACLSVAKLFKIQLLLHATGVLGQHEKQKTATYKHRGVALLLTAVHLVPLAGTLTLAILNSRSVYVGNIPVSILTALQFGAKLLELLSQASIADMVLALIRHCALGGSSIPFGSLLTPYRTTDLSLLWSLDLWGCFTSSSLTRWRRFVLCTLLPTAVVTTALIGPSSAVLMIPRPMQHVSYRQLSFVDSIDHVYPRQIKFNKLNGISDGFDDAYLNRSLQTAALILNTTWLAPVVDSFGAREIQVVRSNDTNHERSLATIPTIVSMGPIYDQGMTQPASMVRSAQPFVISDCWSTAKPVSNDLAGQYVDYGPDKPHLRNLFKLDMLLENYTKPSYDTSFAQYKRMYPTTNLTMLLKEISAEKAGSQLAHVAGVTSYFPIHECSPIGAVITCNNSDWLPNPILNIIACTTTAYWATTSMNVSSDGAFRNAAPSRQQDSPDSVLALLKDRTPISLNPDWAGTLLTMTGDGGFTLLTGRQSVPFAIGLSYLARGFTSACAIFDRTGSSRTSSRLSNERFDAVQRYVEANHLLDHYDRVTVNSPMNTSWTDPATLARMEYSGLTYGYGFDLGPVTVKLALVIVLLYATFASSYIAYSLFTGCVARSWDSVAELVTLALNSERSPELENTSVGIDTLTAFRQPVNIRVSDDNSLSLVFGSDGDSGTFQRVTANTRY